MEIQTRPTFHNLLPIEPVVSELAISHPTAPTGSERPEPARPGTSPRFFADRLNEGTPRDVAAWAREYLRGPVSIDLDAAGDAPESGREAITRRQAWQFSLVPVSRSQGGGLVVATTERALARSAGFIQRDGLKQPVHLLIASEPALRRRLRQYYPWPAMEQLTAAHRSGNRG